MASKVDHTMAKIPNPTPELIDSMGRAILTALVDHDLIAPCDWKDIEPYNKDTLLDAAKRTYAVVALRGGARLRPIV